MEEEKKSYFRCLCGNEIIQISKYPNEEDIYLTIFKHIDTKYKWIERVKYAFQHLRTGKTHEDAVILSKMDAILLKNSLEQFTK